MCFIYSAIFKNSKEKKTMKHITIHYIFNFSV